MEPPDKVERACTPPSSCHNLPLTLQFWFLLWKRDCLGSEEQPGC